MLPDELLDAVAFEPYDPPRPGAWLAVRADPSARVLADLLAPQHWSLVRYFARCAHQGSGADFDDKGWIYDTDDLEPGERDFAGVIAFVPRDLEVNVSRDAFDRLLRRYFEAIVERVRQTGDPALGEPWWAAFLDDVRGFALRTQRSGP